MYRLLILRKKEHLFLIFNDAKPIGGLATLPQSKICDGLYLNFTLSQNETIF
jgi:hypothetical protein